MNDQPSSQATTEQQSNGLNEENWLVESLPDTPDVRLRGFLQLCADRRFHSLLQNEFQRDAGLEEPTDYWIHADAGGTPKMGDRLGAPDYCYDKMRVKFMGWSAHGATCGGFPENPGDDVIRERLDATFEIQRGRYPEASHFCYFVTEKKEGDKKKTVVYSKKYLKGSD